MFLGAVPLILFFVVSDANDQDWRAGALAAMAGALLVALLNLSIAAVLNTDENGWRGDHRANGTAIQSHTPIFLGMAGAAGAAWSAQWFGWPLAIALYCVGTAAYYIVPALRLWPVRAAVIARRRAFARAQGYRFAPMLPELSQRWNFGPFAAASSLAESLNRPPAKLRGFFAGMSGEIDGFGFTIVDAFSPKPWVAFPRWHRSHVTVCAVHLNESLPHLRVALAGGVRRKRLNVVYDCVLPDFAKAVISPEVITEMAEWSFETFEIQGDDLLTVLPPVTRTAGETAEADLDDANVEAAEGLIAVASCLSGDLATWRTGASRPRPIPDDVVAGS
jgi:hypothetical protein